MRVDPLLVLNGNEPDSDQQFGDLDRVERGTLSQVVAAHEERETTITVDTGVATDATDDARVDSGRRERCRDIGDDHSWG